MSIYLQKKPKRINSVSVTLTLIVIGGGYLLWFWIPAYWPIFQLTGIMRGACNDAYHETNNEKVIEQLVVEARRTRLKISKDNFRMDRARYTDDELRKLPGGNRNDRWARRGKTCIIEMHYEDDYVWPLIGKTQHLVFEKRIETELTPVTWEKNDWSLPEGCRCVRVPRQEVPGQGASGQEEQSEGGPPAWSSPRGL